MADEIQAVFDQQGNIVSPGKWDPRMLIRFFRPEDLIGNRILDIGANTGGLSLELARRGAHVVASEPVMDTSAAQEIAAKENLNVEFRNEGLFSSHQLGSFDIVICFGLIYHFRNPHYVLDYLSSLGARVLYISTQTIEGDEVKMVNRAVGLLSRDYNLAKGTRGWHFTHSALKRMLQASGFDNIESLTGKPYNFPDKPKGATNSAYYRAVCVKPVADPWDLNERYEARW